MDNRTGVTQTRPAQTVPAALTYGYDALDRLTSGTNAMGSPGDENFAYDASGPDGRRRNMGRRAVTKYNEIYRGGCCRTPVDRCT